MVAIPKFQLFWAHLPQGGAFRQRVICLQTRPRPDWGRGKGGPQSILGWLSVSARMGPPWRGPQYARGWGRPGVGRSICATSCRTWRGGGCNESRKAGTWELRPRKGQASLRKQISQRVLERTRVGSRWNYEIAKLTAGLLAVIPKFQHFEILQF